MAKANDEKSTYDHMAKVLVLGDSTVGKTCFLTRFCDGAVSNAHIATIGIDFMIKTIEVEGKRIKLQIMDTAGQEKYRSIVQTFYKGAVGVLLLYSVDDERTFSNIDGWMKQIKSNAIDNACVILVGHKCDMSERQVEKIEGEKMARKYGIKFYEASAKEGTNVEEAFFDISKQIKDKFEDGSFKKPDLLSKEVITEVQRLQHSGLNLDTNVTSEVKSGCVCCNANTKN